LVNHGDQVTGLGGEAGQDLVGAAQTGPVEQGLLVGDPLPARGHSLDPGQAGQQFASLRAEGRIAVSGHARQDRPG
jgi:hypothetical protein